MKKLLHICLVLSFLSFFVHAQRTTPILNGELIGPLNVGTNKLSFDAGTADLNEGELAFNADEGTLLLGMKNKLVGEIMHISYMNAVNEDATETEILKGEAVGIASTSISTNGIGIERMVADETGSSWRFIGVAAQNIAFGTKGKVAVFGDVENIEHDWPKQTVLYVSTNTPGLLVAEVPVAPQPVLIVGVTTESGLFVNRSLSSGSTRRLQDLLDVNTSSLESTGQFPVWNEEQKEFDFTRNITEYLRVYDSGDGEYKILLPGETQP